jgi:nitrate/nitrite transporter NarK
MSLEEEFTSGGARLDLLGRVHGRREAVLVIMCLVQFFAASCVIVFAVLPDVVSVVASSPLEASFLVASPMVTTLVLPVPVSLASRRFGGRVVTVVLSAVSGTGLAVACAVVQWVALGPRFFPLFIILGLCFGCGSVTFNAAIIQCSWWFPLRHQGLVAGLLLFFWVFGVPVFGVLAAPMILATSTSSLLLFWCLCVIFSTVMAALFAADPPSIQLDRCAGVEDNLERTASLCFGQEVFPVGSLSRDLRHAVVSCSSLCIIHIGGVTLGCFLGLLVWIPTLFGGIFGVSASVSGYILFGYGSAGAIATVLAGFASDKLNVWTMIAVFLTLSCGGFVCVAASTSLPLSIVAVVACAFASMTANTCCYKLIMMCCQGTMTGTIGWMETASNLVGFLLPFVFGPIAVAVETMSQGLRIGLCIPAGLLLSSIVPFLVLFRSREGGNN